MCPQEEHLPAATRGTSLPGQYHFLHSDASPRAQSTGGRGRPELGEDGAGRGDAGRCTHMGTHERTQNPGHRNRHTNDTQKHTQNPGTQTHTDAEHTTHFHRTIHCGCRHSKTQGHGDLGWQELHLQRQGNVLGRVTCPGHCFVVGVGCLCGLSRVSEPPCPPTALCKSRAGNSLWGSGRGLGKALGGPAPMAKGSSLAPLGLSLLISKTG